MTVMSEGLPLNSKKKSGSRKGEFSSFQSHSHLHEFNHLTVIHLRFCDGLKCRQVFHVTTSR